MHPEVADVLAGRREWAVACGDCLDVLPTLAAGSVDAVVTDPPYGLEFMGKDWDRLSEDPVSRSWDTKGRTMTGRPTRREASPGGRSGAKIHKSPNPRCLKCGRSIRGKDTEKGFRVCHCEEPEWSSTNSYGVKMQAWHRQWAAAVLRVLRPGGYLLAFGGTRTWHRLACALEDAGFEMRDTLMWLHGQGFPKGKGCMKPAWEPVLLCRKPGKRVLPLPGLDGCRVSGTVQKGAGSPGFGADREDGYEMGTGRQYQNSGRWPANLVLSCACPEGGPHSGACPVRLLDGQSGDRSTRDGTANNRRGDGAGYMEGWAGRKSEAAVYGDTGGASRFFYCAKASRAEREAGLEGMPTATCDTLTGDTVPNREDRVRRNDHTPAAPRANIHPTVKPLALMRWLVRLVTPPGGLCLDPFLGSGTTAVACALEALRCVGIERETEYAALARRRLEAAERSERESLFPAAGRDPAPEPSLFGEDA